MAATAPADEVHRVVSTVIDTAFYRAVYPELDGPGFDPIRHYLERGWREGRDPAPWFSVRRYLQHHPDIAEVGAEPFLHYLTTGRGEGREIFPSKAGESYLESAARVGRDARWSFEPAAALSVTAVAAHPAAAADATASERDIVAAEFDVAYYLALHPDVAAAGVDPVAHFLSDGWLEGRDPSPRFSVKDYLEANPDVAQTGVNPFVHYLVAGRAEGRPARSELGFRYRIIANMIPVEERVARAFAASAAQAPLGEGVLAAALARSRSGQGDLHITFSHDDYTTNLGGVQLCLQREAARFAELGRDHLHLYPSAAWPVVRATEAAPLGVVWNGRSLGLFAPDAIAHALARLGRGGARSFAIHSLLGHQVDEVVAILGAAGLDSGFFWLHDFASLCAGYHLLRNDVQDCAAPPPDSAACGICAYAPWRGRHLTEHQRLFDALRLTVVSPSEPTLRTWREGWSFPTAGEIVHPHARLVERARAPEPEAGPFRIAYVGFPVPHKGWPVFHDLALAHADDDRYAFLHLGSREAPGAPVEYHPLTVSDADPRAMQTALEALQIDAVLVWPLCRETFSFAAYEVAAAGAAVITGPDSGNVAAFVEASGHGRVLQDEAALTAAMASGEILDLARARRRPWLYDMAYSGMTADLLAETAGA